MSALAGRVMAKATPQELCKIFQTNTSAQADKLAEAYLGTWLMVSGKIFDVIPDASKKYLNITMHLGNPYPLVLTYFDKELQQVAVLQRGHQVSILGRISGIDSTLVTLKECELV